MAAFLITTFLTQQPVFAQQEGSQNVQIVVNYEKINPDSFLYPLKRLWEKVNLALIFDDKSRQQYMQKLVDNRFKELVYIANNKKLSEFNQASSRYNSFIGEYLSKYSDAKKTMGDSAKNYERILSDLRSQYESDYAYWSFLTSSQETTRQLEGS